MGLTVTPLHPTIGAEISGVDLRRLVPPDAFAAIEAAFNRRAVLIFPDQRLSDDEQIAFSKLFGPLELNPNYAYEKRRIADRAIADISNLDERGEIHTAEDRRRHVQPRQPTLAHRQLVQARAGEMLAALGT